MRSQVNIAGGRDRYCWRSSRILNSTAGHPHRPQHIPIRVVLCKKIIAVAGSEEFVLIPLIADRNRSLETAEDNRVPAAIERDRFAGCVRIGVNLIRPLEEWDRAVNICS